jgi:S-adenosylmethionine/arginine decarboxylase-like enzyme
MTNQYFGYHLTLDCKEGKLDAITNPYVIGNFSYDLVQKIKMKAYGKPIIESFAHDDPETGGITLVQLIETSNITCHFVEKSGDFYLDVFSCAPFDPEVVIQVVNFWFEPKSIKQQFLHRKA